MNMTMLQIDLTDKQNEIVEIYKAKKRLETKAEAVMKLIEEYDRQMR